MRAAVHNEFIMALRMLSMTPDGEWRPFTGNVRSALFFAWYSGERCSVALYHLRPILPLIGNKS